MKLREIIKVNAVNVSLKADNRDAALSEMVESLVEAGALAQEIAPDIVSALVRREKNGSTGFGKGVAVPHAKHVQVPELMCAIGLSPGGIDFNALDRKPVHSVFLLLSPLGADQSHLRAMEVIFRALNQDIFRRFLRQADTREKVVELLDETDAGK